MAIIHGENSSSPGEIEVCPTRNQRVLAGDRAVMIGTADESAERGIKLRRPAATRYRRAGLRRVFDAVRTVVNDFNPAFYPALAAALTLIVISMTLLRYNYQHPRMSWVDALYFTIETITTTGYGDFSFAHQETWLRMFAAGLMFGGATTIALLVAFIADVLLSRRFVFASARPRMRHLRNHVIVVGLSALGMRVITDLVKAGHDVAVIEINEDNRFLSAARALDVPVIFGDATLKQTLEAARVQRARAVAVLTRDDMINIETGIVLAEMLGPESGAQGQQARRHLGGAPGVRPGAGSGGRAAFRLRERPLLGRAGRAVVHRRRDGSGGAGHLLDRPELVHGRRDAGGRGQRTRRAADGRSVEQNTGDRDLPAGLPHRPAAAP